MDDVELFTFPGSNACITVELLLDHAGVTWRERRMRPGLHVLTLRRAGFSGPTAPAARIDGTRIQGSRAIASAIAERLPAAGLLPAAAEPRAQVLEAERDGERLQVAARRLVYVIGQRDPSVIRPLVDANYGIVPGPLRGLVTRALVAAASKGHGARRDRVDHELDKVATLLGRFDTLVEAGVLGTATPTVADFQIAPNLALLAMAPELGAVLRARPSWQIAERLLPRYPLDVEPEAPAGWAARLAG